MLETLCPLGGGEMLSEPGPRPVRERRYEEVTFCNTSQFVLVHSWTNGESSARNHLRVSDPAPVPVVLSPPARQLKP